MTAKTTAKERIYDEKLSPLMAQIIEICGKAGISMLATFDIGGPEEEDLMVTTQLPDETGKLSKNLRSRQFDDTNMVNQPNRPNPVHEGGYI